AGGNAGVTGIGQSPLASQSNYFTVGAPLVNVANYGGVLFPNVYTGVDLYYGSDGGLLEYGLTMNPVPGARVHSIRLAFPAGTSLSLDSIGRLVIGLPDGQQVVNSLPLAFQVSSRGVVQAVPSSFVLVGGGQVGFTVGAYDPSLPLTID